MKQMTIVFLENVFVHEKPEQMNCMFVCFFYYFHFDPGLWFQLAHFKEEIIQSPKVVISSKFMSNERDSFN